MPIKCIFTGRLNTATASSDAAMTLNKVEIAAPPDKISYLSGESFDPTGMVIKGSYNIGSEEVAKVPITGYIITPTILIDNVTEATIKYTEDGVVRSVTLPITVKRALTSIEVTTLPAKTTYEYLDSLNTAGMVITANYTDGSSATVTDYIYESINFNNIGVLNITISYTEDNITKTAILKVTVDRKSIPKPSWKNNLTYNKNSLTIVNTELWNNYNVEYMTVKGTTSATDAGTYTAIFVLEDKYKWNDGSIERYHVDWTIDKAKGVLSVNPTTINIDATNLSVPINVSGVGTIILSPTNINGLTLDLSDNILTITGDGSIFMLNTEITILASGNNNYTASDPQKITVSAMYWEWGDETAEGDAVWWAGLRSWMLLVSTPSERKACEGKTKKMRLSSAVLGTNVVTMQCIGADLDGDKTLAFQTWGSLPTATTFGNPLWINSIARSLCRNFYSNCAAKDSIKTVSKGTCLNYSSRYRKGSVTYNDETVFIPSEREIGLDSISPISVANSTTTKAECTYGYNEAYHYYTSNDKRIRYYMDENGEKTTGISDRAWLRSRHCDISDNMCSIYRTGYSTNLYYNYSSGFSPAFVIG